MQFFGAKILAKKLRVKCLWNWHLDDFIIQRRCKRHFDDWLLFRTTASDIFFYTFAFAIFLKFPFLKIFSKKLLFSKKIKNITFLLHFRPFNSTTNLKSTWKQKLLASLFRKHDFVLTNLSKNKAELCEKKSYFDDITIIPEDLRLTQHFLCFIILFSKNKILWSEIFSVCFCLTFWKQKPSEGK